MNCLSEQLMVHVVITYRWYSLVDPVVDEVHSLQQVCDPGGEWLEGGVRLARPHGRHHVDEEGVGHLLQCLGHHHKTLKGLQQVVQALVNHTQQFVVP